MAGGGLTNCSVGFEEDDEESLLFSLVFRFVACGGRKLRENVWFGWRGEKRKSNENGGKDAAEGVKGV